MQHFIGRKAMNIDGLGDETIEAFYQKGLLNHISDIYELHTHSDELKQMDRLWRTLDSQYAGGNRKVETDAF